ncbi:unnamed protein product [Closterium sp. NIES-65]|nr:unnamed protein product [Closterium sp. NIES-65]
MLFSFLTLFPLPDTCALKACGVNGWCMKFGTTKVASCLCYTGFELQPDGKTCTGYRNVLGTCVGIDPCGGCPVGPTCTATASGNVPYCMCPPGYGMTSTGCISGATPTVSSTSITYDQTNYTVTFNTYTMRLNFNAAPPSLLSPLRPRDDSASGQGAWGARDCAAVYAFPWSSWCIGPKTTLRPPVNGTGGSM